MVSKWFRQQLQEFARKQREAEAARENNRQKIYQEEWSWIKTHRNATEINDDFRKDLKKYTEKIISPICRILVKNHGINKLDGKPLYKTLFEKSLAYKAYSNYELNIANKEDNEPPEYNGLSAFVCSASTGIAGSIYDRYLANGEIRLIGDNSTDTEL